MKAITLAAALMLASTPVFAAPLLFEGFNDATTPAGWATEIVNDPGADPALTYVTASSYPPGFAPYEGARFVRFNSFDCPGGAVIRLKYTNGFSSVGYAALNVQFAWTEDSGYSGSFDFATLEWSTNGTTWDAVTNVFRYNVAGNAWSLKNFNLPAGALNQSNLMLAVRFTSLYGNDCYFDALTVESLAPNVYILPFTQTKQGLPKATLAYTVTITNQTPAAAAFALTYRNTNWMETGTASTPVLPPGAATSILVSAQVPASALPNAVNTATVVAVQGSYANTAEIVSQCIWSKTLLAEPFTTAASTNGWASYFLTTNQLGWFWSTGSGNPAPALRHGDVTVTMIVSNWIVAPVLDFGGFEQISLALDFITFVTAPRVYYYSGAYISTGSPNPAIGQFIEVARASGAVSVIDPVSADLSAFRGNTSVYFALLYIGTNSHRAYADNITILGTVTAVDNAQLAGPPVLALTSYQSTPVLTGLLYRAGETGGLAPAPNYQAQIGYGDRGTLPGDRWVWCTVPYRGASQSNDVYAGSIPVTRAGEFDVAVRFRKSTGPWAYGDLNGSTNGYSSAQAIKLTAICPPPIGGLLYQQQMAPPPTYYFFGYVNPPTITNIVADDFAFGSNVMIQTVRWTGFYPSGRAGNETGFWLRIYADNPTGFSHPGALLREEFHPGYACEFTTNILWHYQADLAAPFFALQASTYWFSAQLQCTTVWGIVNSPAGTLGMQLEQSLDGTLWGTNDVGAGMGFELYGIVPEPWLAALLGLACAAIMRRRVAYNR